MSDLWKHELERKHPMKVVLTTGTSNHMVVIGGYSPNGFYLYDPATYVKGKRQIVTYEELEAGEYADHYIDSVTFVEDGV
jgi:hypothetical protein